MVKTSNATFAVFLALVLCTGAAVAQHDHSAMTEQPQITPTSPTSRDMMKSCQKHGSETMAALDKLENTIAAGRESKDPAKMKAALDTAHEQLAEAKHHMSMCPMMSGGNTQQGDMEHMDMDHMKNMPNESEHH